MAQGLVAVLLVVVDQVPGIGYRVQLAPEVLPGVGLSHMFQHEDIADPQVLRLHLEEGAGRIQHVDVGVSGMPALPLHVCPPLERKGATQGLTGLQIEILVDG